MKRTDNQTQPADRPLLRAVSPSLVALPAFRTWFPGLNALRFLAAALVVIMHTHNNMGGSGLPQLTAVPILFKGLTAVCFFFVLSGFLITYLLLVEQKHTATISIPHFYLRRVFRIWPLYFIVTAMGMLFYWKLVPAMHLNFENNYPHGWVALMYVFFLANLASSLFHTGGMLHVAWSVAVEEQFYLFWAPLVKRNLSKLLRLIITVSLLSFVVAIANTFNLFGLSPGLKEFVDTLQFHYMGMGALAAWLLFYRQDWLLRRAIFTSRGLQLTFLLAISLYLFLYMKSPVADVLTILPIGFLFTWLIINISSNPKRIFSLDTVLLNYLGKISYGIYMYHMPVVYATAYCFQHLRSLQHLGFAYFPVYFFVVFIFTISIASASYYLIEQPILNRLKKIR